MNLKIKDIAQLLGVSEKKIYRWIQEQKIPAYKINHQYRFNKLEINDWILKNRLPVSAKIYDLSASASPVRLTQLLSRGRIFYHNAGASILEAIRQAGEILPLPPGTDRKAVIFSLLQREDMMPTAIGRGIAIPHPRNPIIADVEHETISMFLLQNPVDFEALDQEAVHTLFIVLSANPQRHLEILTKISFLCQQDDFLSLLKKRSVAEKIFDYIQQKEMIWLKQDRP